MKNITFFLTIEIRFNIFSIIEHCCSFIFHYGIIQLIVKCDCCNELYFHFYFYIF